MDYKYKVVDKDEGTIAEHMTLEAALMLVKAYMEENICPYPALTIQREGYND